MTVPELCGRCGAGELLWNEGEVIGCSNGCALFLIPPNRNGKRGHTVTAGVLVAGKPTTTVPGDGAPATAESHNGAAAETGVRVKLEDLPDVRELLDELVGFVRRFVSMTESQAVVVALWIFHTHVITGAERTPFLAITSAEKRSGKTRLLDVLELLVRRAWRVISPSEAVMFRKIERDQPTLLLDETDAIFKSAGERTEPLRALLNAGNQRGTTVPRCVGANRDELHDFNVFCAKALAGIGRLPDTVADRSIPVRLKRRAPSEPVERFRRRRAAPEADTLRAAVERLAEHHVYTLAEAEPSLPEALDDRAWDSVEPLLAIADLAGADWSESARAALLELYGARELDDESMGLRLLTDVKAIFANRDADRLPTESLLDSLRELSESPWGEWYGKPLSSRSLAKLLRPYAIRPHSDGTSRGYKREAFEDAWSRYLPPQVSNRQEPASQSQEPRIPIRHPEPPTDTSKSAANRHADRGSDALTDTGRGERP
jgi:hypothetical protein